MSLSEADRMHLYLEMKQVLYGGAYLNHLGALHDRFIGLAAEDLNCFAIWAMKMGDDKIIELFRLTRTRIPPMARQTETAVHVAAQMGPGIMRLLSIDALFDLYTFQNYRDNRGLTHFHAACLTGNTEIMGLYWRIGDVDLNATFDYGPERVQKTALHLAVAGFQNSAIEWLVYNGADLEVPDGVGLTPVNELCLKLRFCEERHDTAEKCARVLGTLLRLGADANTTDQAGNSPLLNLFNHGVLVNAHFELQTVCFRLLVIYGADLTFKSALGGNVYHSIALNTKRFFGHDQLAIARLKWVMERLFTCLGSNAIDEQGNTPLSLAVANLHSPLVRIFLDNLGAPSDCGSDHEADRDADEVANGHADEVANGHADEVANGHADEVANGHADEVANGHADEVANGNADEVANGHADEVADEVANGDAEEDADEDSDEDADRDADERARTVVNTINFQQGCFVSNGTEMRDLVMIDNCLRIVQYLTPLPHWGWTWERKSAILTFLKGPSELTQETNLSRVLYYGSYDVIETYLRTFIMSPHYQWRNPFLHQCIFDIWKFVAIIDIGELHVDPELITLLDEASLYLTEKLPESEREKDPLDKRTTTMRIHWEICVIQGLMLRGNRSILEFCQTDPRYASVIWHFSEGIPTVVPGRWSEIEGFVHGHVTKSLCHQLFDEEERNPANGGLFAENN